MMNIVTRPPIGYQHHVILDHAVLIFMQRSKSSASPLRASPETMIDKTKQGVEEHSAIAKRQPTLARAFLVLVRLIFEESSPAVANRGRRLHFQAPRRSNGRRRHSRAVGVGWRRPQRRRRGRFLRTRPRVRENRPRDVLIDVLIDVLSDVFLGVGRGLRIVNVVTPLPPGAGNAGISRVVHGISGWLGHRD